MYSRVKIRSGCAGQPPVPITARAGLTACLLGACVFFGVLPSSARAQEIICCKQLVRFGGDWFGALRQCRQKLETATTAQRLSVCEQIKGGFCEDVVEYCQPCKGDEAKKRNPGGHALGPGDPAYDGMVDGARAAGIANFGPEHIAIQGNREKDHLLKWQIRLDTDGCPMPGGDCILWAGENGNLPEGKQIGAKQMLIGAIQFAGNSVRVNGRYVSVETGVVQDAAVGPTITGTGRAAIAQAMAGMLQKLGLRCKEARGLTY